MEELPGSLEGENLMPAFFSQERAEQEGQQDIVSRVIDSLLGRASSTIFTRDFSLALPDYRVPVIYPAFLPHLPTSYLNL